MDLSKFLRFWFSEIEDQVVVITTINRYTNRIEGSYPFWTHQPEKIIENIGELMNENVYFSAYPYGPELLGKAYTEDGNTRGNSSMVASMPGFRIDVDTQEGKHARKDLPVDKIQALDIINKAYPHAPSVIVETGGGIHCYWKFKEPFIISSDEKRQEALQLSRSFQDLFTHAFKRSGFHLDNVSDLARIMRLPGTFNFKSGQKKVLIANESTFEEYNLTELREYLPETIDFPSEMQCHNQVDLDEILSKCAFLKYAFENQSRLPEPLWHALISNVATIRPGGVQLCHLFSKGHPEYNQKETDQKILSAINGSAPITCQMIRERGFDCPEKCYVKSPAGLFSRRNNETRESVSEGEVEITQPNQIRITNTEYRLPAGYIQKNGAIFLIIKLKKPKKILVIPHAIAPTKLFTGLKDRKVSVEVSAFVKGKKISVIKHRETIASREITTLASDGIHVNCNNASLVSELLMKMELVNHDLIPQCHIIDKLGWLKAGDDEIFLVGSNYVKCGKIRPINESTDEPCPFEINFSDMDTWQTIAGINIHGSLEEWKKMAISFNPFPYAKIAISAAIISPLLVKLKQPGFVIHFGYPTSSGKSTMILLAESVMGEPEKIHISWNSSRVGIERTSGVLNELAILIDETKAISAKDKPAFLKESIYQHCLGCGKVRGKPNGIQEKHTWTSIMISTGEANVLSSIQDGGGKARVLDLPELPFIEKNPEIAEMIDSVKKTISKNHGHALPMVIAHLTEKPERMQSLRGRFDQINSEIRKQLSSGVGTRQAAAISSVLLGAELLNEVMGLNWDLKDMEAAMVKPCQRVASHGSEGQRALEFIHSFAVSNLQKSENTVGTLIIYRNEVRGQFDTDEISLTTAAAKRILTDNRFQPDAILKEWLE